MKEQKKTDNLLYVANKMDLARNHKCVCYVLMWIDRLWIYCLLSLEPFFSLQFVIPKRNTQNRVLISNQSILSLSSDFLNTCHSFLFGESELVTNDISSTIWISSHLTKFSLTEVNKINNLKKKQNADEMMLVRSNQILCGILGDITIKQIQNKQQQQQMSPFW